MSKENRINHPLNEATEMKKKLGILRHFVLFRNFLETNRSPRKCLSSCFSSDDPCHMAMGLTFKPF